MELNELKERLKSGRVGGCYVFAGEEDYLKRFYTRELMKATEGDEAFAAFNRLSFDGAEVDFAALTDAVSSPPFMSGWHEAAVRSIKKRSPPPCPWVSA